MLKRRLGVAALGLLVLSSCGMLGTAGDGSKGLKVDKAAELLTGVASDVKTWDANGDGWITDLELPMLGLAVTTVCLCSIGMVSVIAWPHPATAARA